MGHSLFFASLLVAVSLALMVLALRLFRQAAATRRAERGDDRAELWIGVFFFAIGLEVLGYTFWTEAAGIAIGIAVSISSWALLAFTRIVFRPAGARARRAARALGFAIFAVFVVPHLFGGPTAEVRVACSLFRTTALLWAFAECARYYRRMRRQQSIGLGDAVVANRFLLWSCWTAGTAVLPLSGLGIRLLATAGWVEDYTVTREPGLGVFVFAGLVASGLAVAALSLWLSFSPPEAYKRWILRRSSALAAS